MWIFFFLFFIFEMFDDHYVASNPGWLKLGPSTKKFLIDILGVTRVNQLMCKGRCG